MKQTVKRYALVTEFERQTSHCPLYLAQRILDEARDYFRSPFPESYAEKLARRAEAVFAKHPFWQRKFQSAQGREQMLASMRHWLASVLAAEDPALFRQLPEDFKIGFPLPLAHLKQPTRKSLAKSPASCRFHGAELLAI